MMLYGCGSKGDDNKSTKITSVNLDVTEVTVEIGSVVELPKFAIASWSDGSETSVGIIWDKTTVDTSKKDSIVYTGTVAGWDGKLVYTVEVTENGAEYIVGARLISNTATVEPKSNFTLPTKAMVKWSIGTASKINVGLHQLRKPETTPIELKLKPWTILRRKRSRRFDNKRRTRKRGRTRNGNRSRLRNPRERTRIAIGKHGIASGIKPKPSEQKQLLS